ncbi:MAG: ATP-binding protein [Ignisphaera sp.]|uniref:ATP-binding protein n=1 Tax=Ignisphaera aggregans TaxID=334771 RepID=A0A7C4JIR0_9CREN
MLYTFRSAIGKVGVVSYPTSVEIVSKNPIPIGTYVAIPFKTLDIISGETVECCAIGVISLTSYRRLIPISPTATASESIGIEDDMLRYAPSIARIIALVRSRDRNNLSIEIPNVPPPPDSEIYLAPPEILSILFSSKKENSIKIGHLLTRPEVEIHININALTKHLFITGTTGSGKSNTVAVLADRIASYGGTVVIYDVHGEYSTLEVGRDVRKISIEYKMNLLEIPPKVLARMIVPEGGATVQRMLVSRALAIAQKVFKELRSRYGLTEKAIENFTTIVKELIKESKSILETSLHRSMFGEKPEVDEPEEEVSTETIDINSKLIDLFKKFIKKLIEGYTEQYGESAEKACTKVDEFFENAAISFEAPSINTLLGPSTLVVLNVSLLSDEQKDHVLKIMLDELLWFSKSKYFTGDPQPILVFIEEAHIFLSTAKSTISRYSIERVAREGRKFGLALGIISQRPRNIDLNALSQVQNFVFMKLVQEADQQAIMNASDMLTEDLARSLASMGTGEALVIGEWVGRFPVFVKIDKHEGKKIGASLDIAEIWRLHRSRATTKMYAATSEATKDFEELFS